MGGPGKEGCELFVITQLIGTLPHSISAGLAFCLHNPMHFDALLTTRTANYTYWELSFSPLILG